MVVAARCVVIRGGGRCTSGRRKGKPLHMEKIENTKMYQEHATKYGFWKVTGKDSHICAIGMKKTLNETKIPTYQMNELRE